MLDQKVNASNFLQFKMAHKAAETTHNINNAFGPGTAKECTVVVQEVLQRRQEPWRWGAQWPYIESLQPLLQKPLQSHYRSWSSYNYTRSCPRIQYWRSMFNAILQSFGIWSKLERWKGSISGCLMSWLKNQKNHRFEVSSSFVLLNSELFLDRIVMCDKKWILYDNWWWPAQWLDREVPPKHLPKPNLHQIKGHGHCLVVCCKSDLLHLSESQQNHYIWEAGSANRWDAWKTAMPAASTGQQKGPNSSC